jgi:hypothetical protein
MTTENWSSRDVQRDPETFKRLQQQERERKAAEAKRQQEADNLERFKRTFIAEGGRPSDAEKEWRKGRSERAARSAQAKAEAARLSMYKSRSREV